MEKVCLFNISWSTVHFLGHELVSDHRALIPRPETEYLVDVLIKEVANGQKSLLPKSWTWELVVVALD